MVGDILHINGKYQVFLEIQSFENEGEYLQILYDRMPTLPQTIHRDTYLTLLLRNIFFRVMRLFSYIPIGKSKSKISKPTDNLINLKIV